MKKIWSNFMKSVSNIDVLLEGFLIHTMNMQSNNGFLYTNSLISQPLISYILI